MRVPSVHGVTVALLVTAIAGSSAVCAAPPEGLQPEVLETLLRMRVISAVLDTRAINASYPGPTAGLVPVPQIGGELLPRARSLGGAARDAWNSPLLYWSDGRGYLILSLGSDRKMQFDYTASPPYTNIAKGWAGSDPADDLLIVDGVVYRGPASQSELLRRAMSDLRSMGTACESFAVDTNVYPGPVEPIDVVARIELSVEPIYIRVLPKVDPWGTPYRVWSDAYHYALVSYGPDGIPDHPYTDWGPAEFGSLEPGPTTRFGQDLIFVTGAFVQWPAVVGVP